jgi:diadenosine tetraphosphate (Ap4A) HIT family hydrolase
MDTWQALSRGIDCPLCTPRRAIGESLYPVRQLEACSLYLVRDQRYRGACRAIYDPRHVNRIDELSLQEWQILARDLWRAQHALMHTVQAEHLNLASLGNELPHLHWHLIPRYRSDGLWGTAIWRPAGPGAGQPPQLLPEAEYAALAREINRALDAHASS